MNKLLSRIVFFVLTSICAALALPVLAHTVGVHAVPGTNASLSVKLIAQENGVQFVLSNSGDTDVSVLTWETPLEAELTQDVFHLTSSTNGKPNVFGERARYSGRLIKRGHPQAKDFVTVKAGDSVSSVVALSDYYLVGDGVHSVTYAGEMVIQSNSNERRSLSVGPELQVLGMQSESVTMNLVSTPATARASIAGFQSCSADQQAALASDINASEAITRDALTALTDLPESERSTSPRYLQWFGDFSPNRYATVTDIYRNAIDVFEDGSTEFICDCDEPFFAFVFPVDPFRVFLCEFYWRAAQTGTDSRAGTILHELSHFPEVAGTRDNAYGQTAVASLARSNPAASVNNADTVEYFAENTPFIDISSGGALPPQQFEFTELPLDTPVTGSLAQGESIFYRVDGADFVELTTLSGDADLFIFSSAARTERLCESVSAGAIDRCELSGLSTAFVEVFGFAASDYSIRVAANDTPLPEEQRLVLGQTLDRDVGLNEFQFYTVEGADFVQINSLTGDADLAVHSNALRTTESLLCISNNIDPLDVCEIAGGTAFVTVFGFTAADFEITSSTRQFVAPVADDETTVTGFSDPAEGSTADGSPTGIQTGGSGGGRASVWFVFMLLTLLVVRRRMLIETSRTLAVRTLTKE